MTFESLHLLNRLLAIHCRSFPQYLQYSRPFVPVGRQDVMEIVGAIVHDQNGLADRVNRMISVGGGLPHTGEFPMEFTDMHDLDIDFLIDAAIAYQEQDVALIERLADSLQTAPAAKAIAEEALGMAKGHLDSLRELREPSATA